MGMKRVKRDVCFVIAAALALVLVVVAKAGAEEQPVLVFAAASLKNALDDARDEWQARSGKVATISYAAASALAKQIEQGAPADIFISADLDWMKYISDKGLTAKDSERRLLSNKLVLIAPRDAKTALHLAPGINLRDVLGDGMLAMCDLAVPAGKYGKASLESLGLWDQVKDKTAFAPDVRAALLLVSRAEAPLGIVYATDARVDPNVAIVDEFPENSHPPIIYPIALTANSTNLDAASFLAFVESPAGRPFFERQGFIVLVDAPRLN
jgi:molybdate transport system substrate-binding protein